MMHRFVAVEGIDGAGKSALVRRLAAAWSGGRNRVVGVDRHFSPELAELMRQLSDNNSITTLQSAQLAAADYALGEATVIRPALASGAIVLADRTFYSHIVFHELRGLTRTQLEAWFGQALLPDRVIFLDLPPAVALRRLRGADRPSVWEAGLDLRLGLPVREASAAVRRGIVPQEQVEQHFLLHQQATRELLLGALPRERTAIVDATGSPEEVLRSALRALSSSPATGHITA